MEDQSEIKKGIRSNKDKTKINISFWSWRKREQKWKEEEEKEEEKRRKKEGRKKEDHRYGSLVFLYGCYELCRELEYINCLVLV